MPWCAAWGAAGGFWWVLPIVGLVLMGLMFLVCFRGSACGCGGWRRRGAPPDLEREVEALKEDVRKLSRQPS